MSEGTRTPVTVVGYDGAPLSADAAQVVAAAELVVGGRRHLAAVDLPAGARTIVLGAVEQAVVQLQEAHDRGERVVVLASGDPGFFGIVRLLSRHHLPLAVLPARSSVAAAFARLGLPWDDAIVVSAHGRDRRTALNVLRRFGGSGQPVAVLTDADSAPDRLVDELGDECPRLVVFERLGEPDETMTHVLPGGSAAPAPGVLSATKARNRRWEAPNLVITTGRPTHPAAPLLQGRRAAYADEVAGWGLPDELFAHRDGMLTKRDVRAVVLARLAPGLGQLVWDVGAGSGSVAVECSRLGAAAVAVERDPQALHHINDNAARHHAPVRVVHGAAPAVLAGLPQPDAVFVGGGGPDVVTAVAAVRPPRLVVALATLERVAPTVAALAGYDVDTVLVQVQQLQPLGDGHRLAPTNPVFVVSGVLT
jgi:precorrin-6Y C5,15-methyltransferase (decarboxylating)